VREREKERGRVGRWIKETRRKEKKGHARKKQKREECGVLL
jgi:hypothetical protein